jgi:hypothetical protein
MRSSKISTIRRGARMRFGRGGFPTVGDAVPYARNSKMLGNRINGDRPDADDGSDYLGNRFAQTTGRAEDERLGKVKRPI